MGFSPVSQELLHGLKLLCFPFSEQPGAGIKDTLGCPAFPQPIRQCPGAPATPMALAVPGDDRAWREQHRLRQSWGLTRWPEQPQNWPVIWNNTDRTLLLKTTPPFPPRGRKAMCWQQTQSFPRREAQNKRDFNAKLFAEVITNRRAGRQKVKGWVQECLNPVFVHSCSYLNVTTTASFCIFLFFCHELQTKGPGKMTRKAQGKTQQGVKKVKMSEHSKAVTREDSCFSLYSSDYKRPYPSKKRLQLAQKLTSTRDKWEKKALCY